MIGMSNTTARILSRVENVGARLRHGRAWPRGAPSRRRRPVQFACEVSCEMRSSREAAARASVCRAQASRECFWTQKKPGLGKEARRELGGNQSAIQASPGRPRQGDLFSEGVVMQPVAYACRRRSKRHQADRIVGVAYVGCDFRTRENRAKRETVGVYQFVEDRGQVVVHVCECSCHVISSLISRHREACLLRWPSRTGPWGSLSRRVKVEPARGPETTSPGGSCFTPAWLSWGNASSDLEVAERGPAMERPLPVWQDCEPLSSSAGVFFERSEHL